MKLVCKNVILLVLIFVVSRPSDAVTCYFIDRSNPNFLCCYDFVLRGSVVNERFTNISKYHHDAVYTVEVKLIYKGFEEVRNVTSNISLVEIHLKTLPGFGAALALQREYILPGRIYKRQLTFMYCDWREKWLEVSNTIKDFLPSLASCDGEFRNSDMRHCDLSTSSITSVSVSLILLSLCLCLFLFSQAMSS